MADYPEPKVWQLQPHRMVTEEETVQFCVHIEGVDKVFYYTIDLHTFLRQCFNITPLEWADVKYYMKLHAINDFNKPESDE
jgi:hypothetical protein